MYGFFKLPISDKKMSKVMYALLRTQSKLVNSFNHSINQYNRKQSSGFLVDIVIEIDKDKVDLFEGLAEVKLQTSEEFQGRMTLNSSSENVVTNSYGIVRWHDNKYEDIVCVDKLSAEQWANKYNSLAGSPKCYVDKDVYLPWKADACVHEFVEVPVDYSGNNKYCGKCDKYF